MTKMKRAKEGRGVPSFSPKPIVSFGFYTKRVGRALNNGQIIIFMVEIPGKRL